MLYISSKVTASLVFCHVCREVFISAFTLHVNSKIDFFLIIFDYFLTISETLGFPDFDNMALHIKTTISFKMVQIIWLYYFKSKLTSCTYMAIYRH